LTLDDSPPAESHEQLETEPEPEEKPRRPRRRPRLNDDHDDLTECPRCGKHAHRDYSRCPYCGLRFSSEPAAERRPYFGRRDSEPHRGGLVLALGIIGICGAFCPLVGLVFGILAWILGQGDLSKMKRGQMDPSGEGITQGGWICGIIATVLSLFMSLGCGGFLIMAAADNAQQRNPPAFGPPPVRQVRPAR
jgi:ribosomal protein L37E